MPNPFGPQPPKLRAKLKALTSIRHDPAFGIAPQIMGSDTGQTALKAGGRDTDQITFGLKPFEAIRPALLIARKIGPAVTPAVLNHA